jgi:hypothetical protein
MNELVLAFGSAVVGFSIGFVTCALFGRLDSDKGHNYWESDEHAEVDWHKDVFFVADGSQTKIFQIEEVAPKSSGKVYWSARQPDDPPKDWK